MYLNNSIPKIIHYCWFGNGEKPEFFKKCLRSWKKHLSDYEIMEWNESNFDININTYTKQAYIAKKYAFVSDVARFYVLYNYGGIYLDTDVKVIKSFDDLLIDEAFVGFENKKYVAPGLALGARKYNQIIKELLDNYINRKFLLDNGCYDTYTVGQYMTNILKKYGFKEGNIKQNLSGLVVYPYTYFCPTNGNDYISRYSKDTYSLHLFANSWGKRTSRSRKLINTIKIIIRTVILKFISKKTFNKIKENF